MQKLVMVVMVVLAGCMPPPPPGSPATCESGSGACGPQPVPPPPARRQHPEAEKQLDGLLIEAVPAGATGWRIALRNDTDNAARILWDESTFVASTGESAGRLMRGETRRMDMANVQPPAPVAPKSTIVQVVFPEKMYQHESVESEMATRDARTVNLTELARVRAERATWINGGRLVIVIDLGGQKLTWSGVVKAE